jgi:hypothetical protein
MTRSHGPFGPPGAPPRRRPGDDPFSAPQPPGGQWPAHPQHGYGDHAAAPQPTQGYHFPPAEPQPAYGYSNPQLLAPQQWPEHAEPQAYEINYQAYGGEPGPFQRSAHAQYQGHADGDAEFGDDYYEDEEPRRGKRWILIAAALVGAIGVGGALAYTYRSLVAPKSRLEAVKTNPSLKVRSGARELPAAPVKIAEETPPPQKIALPEPPAQEEPPAAGGDNQGPRAVKTIPIMSGSGASASPPPAVAKPAIPGITLYQPPEVPASPPQAAPPVQAPPKDALAPPGGRVTIGTRPTPTPPPAVEDDRLPASPPPIKRHPPTQTAAVTPRLPAVAKARETPSSSGSGYYVAVLKSEKSSMDAVKAYADLQQRYPEVLGTKSFDVQEADLSARGLGTMYRVVVGPPGSHNAASGVCAQLKAAGYVGCWVKQY